MSKIEMAVVSCFGDQNSSISLYNAHTGTFLASYRGGGICAANGLSMVGGYVLASEFEKPIIRAWQLNKQHASGIRMIAPGKIKCVSVSPDSFYIALGVGEKLFIYQTCTGKIVSVVSHHYQDINVVKFNNDGSLITCGGNDGIVSVWNFLSLLCAADGTEPYATYSHTLPVLDLRITFGNRGRIFSVSGDQTCKIFDLFCKNVVHSIIFDHRLSAVELLPNETNLFIGNCKGNILKINIHSEMVSNSNFSNDKAICFDGHLNEITCLAASVEGTLLISGSADETVMIWHVLSYQCLRTIKMKGKVTNAFFYIGPKDMFSTTFKPTAVLKDFVRRENDEGEQEIPILISTLQPLVDPFISSDRSKTGSSTIFEVEEKVKGLEKINNNLYKFSLEKILGRRNRASFENKSKLQQKNKKIKAPKTL